MVESLLKHIRKSEKIESSRGSHPDPVAAVFLLSADSGVVLRTVPRSMIRPISTDHTCAGVCAFGARVRFS